VTVFIDEHRDRFGVEPICRVLGVSASAYYHRAQAEPSVRASEDERLIEVIRLTHKKNYEAYGYPRTWKALRRAGETVPRCQVQRLMRCHGIQGAKRRGKPWRTTKADPHAARRPDLVQRNFTAEKPNRLWVGDLSYLRCWEGIVYFAFVVDVHSRRVVGWQLAATCAAPWSSTHYGWRSGPASMALSSSSSLTPTAAVNPALTTPKSSTIIASGRSWSARTAPRQARMRLPSRCSSPRLEGPSSTW
jgi:hypothetical protein